MPNKAIASLKLYTEPEYQPFSLPGDERGVFLIHGFLGTPKETRTLGEVFNARGWAAEGILLPGLGRDFPNLLECCQFDWIDSAWQAYKTFYQEHDPTILIGYSFGGSVAMQVAARAQKEGIAPEKLVLIAPFWKLAPWYQKIDWRFG